MKAHGKVTFIFLCSVLGGCASMSKDECLTADWYGIGYEDGARGRSITYLSERREACSKHGVTPILAQYRQGHAEGIPHYCTEDTAYRRGARGSSFPAVCDAKTYPEMLEPYQHGKQVYAVKKEIEALEKEFEELEEEIHSINQEIKDNEERIIANETPSEERRTLITRNKALERQLPPLYSRQRRLDREIDAEQQHLRDIE